MLLDFRDTMTQGSCSRHAEVVVASGPTVSAFVAERLASKPGTPG